MGLLRALRDAMRERRNPRIGPAEVERLLAGDPTGPEHRGLAALLDAAQAPASPRELAGEQAAVAGYVAAYREAVPTSMPKGRRRVRIPSPARAAAVKVAAGVVVLAVGGGALAAETGRLPAGAQQRAHDLFSAAGIPAPRTTAPTGTPDATTPPTGTATTRTPTPQPPSTAAVPPPTAATTTSAAAVRGLCRAWAAQQKPHGKAMTAAGRRALAAAAGGADRIPAFCADQLGTPAPTATTKPKGKPSSKPAHTAPGNGNGNSNGHTRGPKQ